MVLDGIAHFKAEALPHEVPGGGGLDPRESAGGLPRCFRDWWACSPPPDLCLFRAFPPQGAGTRGGDAGEEEFYWRRSTASRRGATARHKSKIWCE
eukprot:COSAG02_NODE_3465_length_6695_cov_3.210734_2_plen_96_part_00